MLYHKTGMPEEGELVVCTVTKVYPNSIFVNLNEYGRSGMIHISEVAPGRIRNIRDYVSEGRVVVCKVLGVHEEKGHIDLSLRRVSEMAKREKQEKLKKEMKAEKIIELFAKESKKDTRKLYEEITKKAFEKYEYMFELFQDVVAGTVELSDLIPEQYAKKLEELVRSKVKPEKIEIGGIIKLESFAPDGVDIIKTALKKAEKNSEIKYMGAGRYKIIVTADDFKKAEKILEKNTKDMIEYIEEQEGTGEFIRDKA